MLSLLSVKTSTDWKACSCSVNAGVGDRNNAVTFVEERKCHRESRIHVIVTMGLVFETERRWIWMELQNATDEKCGAPMSSDMRDAPDDLF